MYGIDISAIPEPFGKVESLNRKGKTQDIIRAIVQVDREHDRAFCKFSKQFERNREGLRKLYKFVKNEIKYKEDPDGFQHIQTPRALWNSGVGDCKAKTLFINQVLKCLKIPYTTRFVSYRKDNTDVTHVYSIAHLDGEDIVMDTVYYYFDSEKQPYYHKQDFEITMTHIQKISGIGSNYSPDICKMLAETKEKQSYIPAQQFIPFSKLSAGFARALILRRNLEIKKAMNPQASKVYAAGINLVDSQLKSDFHNSRGICGVGAIPTELQPLAQYLSHLKTLSYPAMRKGRPEPLKIAPIAVGGWNASQTVYTAPDGKVYYKQPDFNTNPSCRLFFGKPATNIQFPSDAQFVFIEQWKYVYARNSQYAKTASSIVKDENGNNSTLGAEVLKLARKYLITLFKGTNYNLHYGPLPSILKIGGNPQLSQDYISVMFLDSLIQQAGTSPAGLQVLVSQFAPRMIFSHTDYRTEFLRDVRMVSGVMDEYINDAFIEEQGIANGFMYSYLNANQLNIVPGIVTSKYAVHEAYIAGCTTFSGLDYNVIKDFGRNTVAYHQPDGKNPEQILDAFIQGNAIQGIGIIPAFIPILAAIMSALGVVWGIVSDIMNKVNQRAESIEPGNIPDGFKPIGDALRLAETDWASGTGGGGNNNGGGGGNNEDEGGGGAGNLLLLGGLGALAYSMFKK